MRFSSARHASINRLASLLSKASSRSFQIAAFLRGRRVEKFMWLDVFIVDANFLYEAGFGSKRFSSRSGVIGITQARCVAVLATTKRVAHEIGVRLGRNDLLLRRYSVIILDEAHERSLNTDFLLWMLTRTINI
ncbi:hypothetical protein Bca4012_051470 [Brassica carinata]|uniref:RNA helicase n=2 Tax=Brassica TaxID=3705 RepID=A0A816KI95_BRANA|nr:unnamed protein product [Brassica napus]